LAESRQAFPNLSWKYHLSSTSQINRSLAVPADRNPTFRTSAFKSKENLFHCCLNIINSQLIIYTIQSLQKPEHPMTKVLYYDHLCKFIVKKIFLMKPPEMVQ